MKPGEESTGDGRQRLVIVAPYPPAKSGIADYVAELMPEMRSDFDVTLVIADDAPLPADQSVRVLLAAEFLRHRDAFRAAPKLYHFGNNAQHAYMLPLIRQEPGIVVLHDFNLGYLHEMDSERWTDRDRLVDYMEREYGRPGGDILRWQFRHEYRETFAGYELPLNGDVLEHATGVIVHSRQVQYKTAARVPHLPVWHVPHHLSPRALSSAPSKALARARLGLPKDEVLITAMGFVTRAKQIPLTLRALESLRRRVPPFRFILAGERRPAEYDVDADIARSPLRSSVTCTDYLQPDQFFDLLAATDIVVNLRYPSSGEMSGTLVRALGMGVPTIVLDYGPIGELPDGTVKKIAWNGAVQTSLTGALRELIADSRARMTLGARAAAYARSVHDSRKIAAIYARILRRGNAVPSCPPGYQVRQYDSHRTWTAQRLGEHRAAATALLPKVAGLLWWSAAPVPLGETADSALVVSADAVETSSLLSMLFAWEASAITAVTPEQFLHAELRGKNGEPIRAKSFAFALVVVPSDLPELKAAALMRRLNAALRRGARVILETSSRGELAATAALHELQLEERLADAGFGTVQRVHPSGGIIPELLVSMPDIQETRFACVTGKKIGDYAVWRFVEQAEGLPQRWGGRTALVRMDPGVFVN